jgi:hypothetical protein
MSQFDEAMDKYRAALADQDFNDELLQKVAQGLGPSIYLADASLVSCSDQEEKDRVKNNFLIGKMGLEDSPALDEAIDKVCEKMSGINHKHRAIFYYHLVVQEGLESKYMN